MRQWLLCACWLQGGLESARVLARRTGALAGSRTPECSRRHGRYRSIFIPLTPTYMYTRALCVDICVCVYVSAVSVLVSVCVFLCVCVCVCESDSLIEEGLSRTREVRVISRLATA